MFGKRKQDHKHLGELPDDAGQHSDDPDLAEALMELGRNRTVPLPRPEDREPTDVDDAALDDESTEPIESGTSSPPNDRWGRDSDEAPSVPAWAGVPTAAMLAEPEPEPQLERDQPSVGGMAMQALNRERARSAEHEAALRKAQDEAAALNAQVEQLQAELAQRPEVQDESDDRDAEALRSTTDRAEEAEQSALELQAKVSELSVELETARAEAAAAGVAVERLERESKDAQTARAVAEERAERLGAEVQQLRSASARGAVQAEGLQRDVERGAALQAAVDQAQSTAEQLAPLVADNQRLASDLAANLRSQESLIAALAGLQTEVTEQRAWFEAQLANMREMEGQQAGVVEALQAAIKDRDADLDALRQQLLDVEAKRAEEAAAFVAALERQ